MFSRESDSIPKGAKFFLVEWSFPFQGLKNMYTGGAYAGHCPSVLLAFASCGNDLGKKMPKVSFTGKEEAVKNLLLREGTPCIIC